MFTEKEEFYETSDMRLCATLLCFNHHIEHIDKKPYEKKCTFYFKSSHELKELIDQYFKHKLLVEPHEFNDAMREINIRIHNN